MRHTCATLAAAAAFALPAAHAATSTLSVPTFSITYSESGDTFDDPAFPTAANGISVASTGSASTTLSLDHQAAFLHQVSSYKSYPAGRNGFASIHFAAAEGYRITGIEFSATISGVLAEQPLPPGAVRVGSGWPPENGTTATAGINGAQNSLYVRTGFTDALTVGGLVENQAGLQAFDYDLHISAFGYGGRYDYSFPPSDPREEPDLFKALGQAEVHYANPSLTVYTQAIAVPEPGTWAMLVCGMVLLAGVGGARRGRN